MEKLRFQHVFLAWFLFALAMHFINGAFIKSWLFACFVSATLGFFLLIFPVYPEKFRWHWDDKKSKRIIRILAVLEIFFSFLIRTTF